MIYDSTVCILVAMLPIPLLVFLSIRLKFWSRLLEVHIFAIGTWYYWYQITYIICLQLFFHESCIYLIYIAGDDTTTNFGLDVILLMLINIKAIREK